MRHARLPGLALALVGMLAACAPEPPRPAPAPTRPVVRDLAVARAPSTLPPEIIEIRPDQTTYLLTELPGSGARVTARWTEPGGAARGFDFPLPPGALDPRAQMLVPPTGAELAERATAAARAAAARSAIPIEVRRQGESIAIQASRGSGPALQAEIDRVLAAFAEGFERGILDAGYRRVGARVIVPDHAGLAQAQAPLVAPVARAFADATAGLPPRERADWLLGFLQSIPYEPPRAADSALRTPAGVLAANRGDCESKSLAMAALLLALDPSLPVVMVRGADHAFLALGLPPAPGDTLIRFEGRELVAAEPVGPGRFELGHVSPLSRQLLLDPAHEVIPLGVLASRTAT